MQFTHVLLPCLGLALLSGCGPASPSGSGSSAPSVSASSATPTASTAAPPSADADYAALKKSALSGKTMGGDWKAKGALVDRTPGHKNVEPGKDVEYCPGHISQAFSKDRVTVAGVAQNFEGKKTTRRVKNTIYESAASLYIGTDTLAQADAGSYRDGYAADLAACKKFKVSNDLYVVLTPEGVTSSPAADEIIVSFTARRYSDKQMKHLTEVGKYVTARKGRAMTSVVIQSVPSKADPQGKDFSEVRRLLDRQLTASANSLV